MKENILKTLAFFDLFNHPLIKKEIFKYSWGSSVASSEGVIPAQAGIQVDKETGLYYLEGRNEVVQIRKERQQYLGKKLKIAERAVKKLRFVPFLRAVFLCNNIAFGTADKDSDIDVFIIVRDGRVWIARFFATLFLHIFFLRRHGNKIKDRICLSFYCSDKYLNLREIRIAKPDVYLIYWIASLIPIYDPDNLEEKVQSANGWILEYVPNGFKRIKQLEIIKNNKFSKLFKKTLEKMWQGGYGKLIEGQMKGAQIAKMKLNAYSVQDEKNNEVIINDKMLKFHENDRRLFYQNEWLKKVGMIKGID